MIRNNVTTLGTLSEGIQMSGDIHVTVINDDYEVIGSYFFPDVYDFADESIPDDLLDLEVDQVFVAGDGRLHIDVVNNETFE